MCPSFGQFEACSSIKSGGTNTRTAKPVGWHLSQSWNHSNSDQTDTALYYHKLLITILQFSLGRVHANIVKHDISVSIALVAVQLIACLTLGWFGLQQRWNCPVIEKVFQNYSQTRSQDYRFQFRAFSSWYNYWCCTFWRCIKLINAFNG